MFRSFLLLLTIAFSNEASSQHILTTRIENTALVQWEENRLKIVVEGHSCRDIVVTATRGEIKMNADDCEIVYSATDTSIHRTTIRIGIKRKSSVGWLKEMDLPVLSIPDPTPMVGGYPSGSSISRAVFLTQSGISVPVANGWHQVQIKSKQYITTYSVKISRKDSVIFSCTNVEGFLFPPELIEFAKSSIQDDEIIFFDMDTLIYGQERRHLNGMYKLIIK
jgi:hypothetical protein